MSALETTFSNAAAEHRAALVGYLPAGYPTVQAGIDAAVAMVRAGVDVIEVGLPYSDPLMDGPTIQDAVHQALVGGVRTADVLHTVEAVAATGAPTLVMTYWNPVERYGTQRFARDLAAAGGSGVITPDLTPEEAGPWLAATDEAELGRVFLVAPSSTDARIATVAATCRGFVYAASLMGATGTRERIGNAPAELVTRVRPHTDLPVAVGLGVSNGKQAAQVAAVADGVIVGSAFVRRLLDAAAAGQPAQAGVAAAGELAAELAGGVRAGSAAPAVQA